MIKIFHILYLFENLTNLYVLIIDAKINVSKKTRTSVFSSHILFSVIISCISILINKIVDICDQEVVVWSENKNNLL